MEQKIYEKTLQSYLSDSEFITYLNRNGILIKRTDNLLQDFVKIMIFHGLKLKEQVVQELLHITIIKYLQLNYKKLGKI